MKPNVVAHESVKQTGEKIPFRIRGRAGESFLPKTLTVKLPDADGNMTDVDVFSILRLPGGSTIDTLTAVEAAERLSEMSAWKMYVWSNYVRVRSKRLEAETAYDLWWAEKCIEVGDELRSRNIEEMKSGIRTKSNLSVTRDAIENHVIHKYQDEWGLLKERVLAWNHKERELNGLFDVLERASVELSVIMKEVGNFLWRK